MFLVPLNMYFACFLVISIPYSIATPKSIILQIIVNTALLYNLALLLFPSSNNEREIEMKQSILNEVLRKHDLWLNGKEGGELADLSNSDLSNSDFSNSDFSYTDLSYTRLSHTNLSNSDLSYTRLSHTNLSYTNLSYTNLSNSDLRYCGLQGTVGNMNNIKSIQVERYEVTYTDKVMQIGCEKYKISEWFNFNDDTISEMDDGALEWWKVWKPILKKIIEISPANPTGFIEESGK